MAHKKAAGAAKNLRDSQPKYRGVKVFGGQQASQGNILVRQKGSKYECGLNTYVAADFTIHASADGIVHFKKKNFKRFDGRTYIKTVVEVLPLTAANEPQKTSKKAPSKQAESVKAPAKQTKKAATKKAPSTKASTTEA